MSNGNGNPGPRRPTLPRIETICAVLSVDPADGSEGICAFYSAELRQWMPLLAADETRLEWIKERAREMARAGIKVRLVRFTNREDMGEIGA